MVVVITGSSKGIGKATAIKFAREGYDIVLNYNNSYKEAIEVKDELEKYNIKVLLLKCDISNEEEVIEFKNKIKEEFNKVDVLINNAGIALDNFIEFKTSKEFRKVLDVNLVGTFLVTKYISTIMDNGVIINISSTNGIDTGYIESIDYDASKAGVISLTHDFAKYLSPNIRVNCICPGWINTSMNENLNDEFKNNEINKIKLHRFGEASEVADSIYYLVKCTYINDAIIRVDGGSHE